MNKLKAIAVLMALVPAMASASGRAVYETVCMACHAPANVMVASPKLGDTAEWRKRQARSEKGIDTLTDHAINGFGAMPPKGGVARLTRAKVRSAIEYMMAVPAERSTSAGSVR